MPAAPSPKRDQKGLPMLVLDEDRRRHPRIALQRPCKLHDPRTGRYHAAVTCDLSESGMMIAMSYGLDLHPGDVLHLAIAQKRRQMLIRATEMIRMRVARCLGTPSGQWLIGLEMIDPVAVDAAALRDAA